MTTFFLFGHYSPENFKGMGPDRTQTAVQTVKKLGGRMQAMYALLGNHDLVLIVDLPDLQHALQASVALSKTTGISFSTAPAVTVAEFDQLMAEV